MKTFVSPGFASLRFDANTSFVPSGENIGNPSNVVVVGDPLEPGAVDVDQVEVEVAPLRVVRGSTRR